MKATLDWPPPYTLRRSPQARSVRLQICSKRGLQIIAPAWFNSYEAPIILQQHRNWIERTWTRIQPQLSPIGPIQLPEQIHLQAMDEIWQIYYQPSHVNGVRIKINAMQIIVSGKTENKGLVKTALQGWLKRRAQHCLVPWLERVSTRTGLQFAKVGIRSATTRWGSCSAKKNISLNCKLLLLPANLVEHVLLHELCHTIYMNHSKQFWDLVRSFDSDCHVLRKQLKQAHHHMPAWIEE